MRPRTDSKIYTLREGVGRHEHVSTYVASTLRQLPDLHSIPRQRGDQQAVPFSIVADIRWAGDPADELDLLARLVARHAGIGPARHENPATRDDDAVESAGALRDHARRLVAGLPAEHVASAELDDDEALTNGIDGDAVGGTPPGSPGPAGGPPPPPGS